MPANNPQDDHGFGQVLNALTQLNSDETANQLKLMATLLFNYHSALIDAGFSDFDAIELTVALQASLFDRQ